MNYYNEIKNKLINDEIYSKVKDYSKERHRVITYFEIGKLLSEAGKSYGDGIIEKYAEKLTLEVGKKYNKRTLFRIRQFYEIFKEQKVSTMSTQLSWSHYREVLSLKDIYEIKYYLDVLCESKNLTQRQLHELIKQKSYNRLSAGVKDKLINRVCAKTYIITKNKILFFKNIYLCYDNNEVS